MVSVKIYIITITITNYFFYYCHYYSMDCFSSTLPYKSISFYNFIIILWIVSVQLCHTNRYRCQQKPHEQLFSHKPRASKHTVTYTGQPRVARGTRHESVATGSEEGLAVTPPSLQDWILVRTCTRARVHTRLWSHSTSRRGTRRRRSSLRAATEATEASSL